MDCSRRRRLLRASNECLFVNCEDFQARSVSRRRLIRSDDAASGLRGLLDPETGERFFIEEENLRQVTPVVVKLR